jgi:DHA2 family methylenomycin A resistance protein-like MFS transporter
MTQTPSQIAIPRAPIALAQWRSSREQRLTLAAASISYIIVILDTSIVNVALERIAVDLATNVAGLQWIVNSYTLTFASLLLSGGTLGDRLGIRRTYMLGLALFTLASAVCGLSPSFAWLLAGRVLQGVGAALLVPCSLALLHHAYPDFTARSKAIALWAGCGAVALAAGPLVGGLLIDLFDWRSIFLVNIPIGLMGLGLTSLANEVQHQRSPRQFDLPGQLMAIVGLGSFVSALIEGPSFGWRSPVIVGDMMVAIVAWASFLVIESRRREPMLPLAFFHDPPFSAVAFISVIGMGCFFGLLFVFSLYFQQVRGYSPIETGVALLPFTVAVSCGNMLSGHFAKTCGPRFLIIAGSLTQIAGYLGMLAAAGASYLALALPLVAIGLGSGIRTPASATALMATVERSRSGIASAVLNVSRQVGVAIGVAVFGALISGPLHLVDGMTVCLWIATCLTAVGAFVVGCAMPGAVAGEPSLPR